MVEFSGNKVMINDIFSSKLNFCFVVVKGNEALISVLSPGLEVFLKG
jgi:hypothetical protein